MVVYIVVMVTDGGVYSGDGDWWYYIACCQVYQASLACSPDGVEAAGGYYHLAGVFLRDNKPAVAISLQDKVYNNDNMYNGDY